MNNPAAMIPQGNRIYAVGDIHGRFDLLDRIHAAILEDARDATDADITVVYLGDYIDRGSCSFEVVEWLATHSLPGMSAVCLRGNHEDMMLGFLEGRLDPLWLINGGIATLHSYGVQFDWSGLNDEILASLRRRLIAALPQHHWDFFRTLQVSFTCGDYLFVHAGVRPGRPLDLQDPLDLMWIRAPFLTSDADFGKRVVHGHTIVAHPEVRPNRIGIDTGAFHSGHLTCLVLEGREIKLINT